MDCPNHLSEQERLDDLQKLGEHSALYRSKYLALFTSLEGQVFIPIDLVTRAIENPPEWIGRSWPDRIGIDFGAGGDETVITQLCGNKLANHAESREKDTTLQVDWIERVLLGWRIKKTHDYIFGDDGGIGHGTIDQLRRRGWNIKRVLNQSPAIDRLHHVNRGSEMWFFAQRLFTENMLIIPKDNKKLHEQLYNRYYKQGGTTVRTALESKKDAKAHGRPSPDRADSLILSLVGLSIDKFFEEFKKLTAAPVKKASTIEKHNLVQRIDDLQFEEYKQGRRYKHGKRSHMSVSAMLDKFGTN